MACCSRCGQKIDDNTKCCVNCSKDFNKENSNLMLKKSLFKKLNVMNIISAILCFFMLLLLLHKYGVLYMLF